MYHNSTVYTSFTFLRCISPYYFTTFVPFNASQFYSVYVFYLSTLYISLLLYNFCTFQCITILQCIRLLPFYVVYLPIIVQLLYLSMYHNSTVYTSFTLYFSTLNISFTFLSVPPPSTHAAAVTCVIHRSIQHHLPPRVMGTDVGDSQTGATYYSN